ncbi:MAG: hypothetical protein ACOC5B_01925 [Myxococcota bacterium]
MRAGIACSVPFIVVALVLPSGCFGGGLEDAGPYSVGDEENLRFWITADCGFGDPTCGLERGLPLDAEAIGIEPKVVAAANSDALPAEHLPELYFSSSRPETFTVRTVECRTPDSDSRMPCPTDPVTSYVVTLDLHAEGRADLVAHLVDDDSVYDQATVRVLPARCGPDSTDVRCPD